MKVLVYPEKTREEFGAERWVVEWQEVKPSSDIRGETTEIDPDTDLIWQHRYFRDKTGDRAIIYAKATVASGCTAYGTVTVQKQAVDWFVEEDRVAEWSDVGEPEYYD